MSFLLLKNPNISSDEQWMLYFQCENFNNAKPFDLGDEIVYAFELFRIPFVRTVSFITVSVFIIRICK